MVNLPKIERIATELAPVKHLIGNGNNGSCRIKSPRKRMGNCGFMRSDRWSAKHGYSYNTVNKYRGVLYGDEAFLPPTPSTGGRIRISNEVAVKLREHGVRPRHSEATSRRREWATKKVNVTQAPAPAEAKISSTLDEISEAMSSREIVQSMTTIAVAHHGITEMLSMLIEAEAEVARHCPGWTANKDTTS